MKKNCIDFMACKDKEKTIANSTYMNEKEILKLKKEKHFYLFSKE